MPRYARTSNADAWKDHADFNEQLYLALRQSPWWMISIAVHVIVFVITGLLYSEAPLQRIESQVRIVANPPSDPTDEDVLPPDPVDPIDDPNPLEEPVYKDVEISDHVEEDNDLPNDEPLGDEGLSDKPFKGPANNGIIGLAGGGGGAFGRGDGGNNDYRRRGGTQARTAVEDALRWLAAHQSPGGGWEAAGFNRWCEGKPASQGPDGAGYAAYDAGATGLALCAFLGAGYTNRGRNPFAKTISKGLRYLKNIQDPEGCFGPRSGHYMYNHACAALAMVEAYGMTGSSIFRRSAQKALDFISLARNPYFVWRYDVKGGDNDTSVTGWMMMALKSASLVNQAEIERGRAAPLCIDEEAFDGIRAWMDKVTDPDTGRAGYMQRGDGPARPRDLIDTFPADKSESMTAVAILARIFTGEDPRGSNSIRQGASLCAQLPPVWDEQGGSIDMYYWYYATLAMFQVGGEQWKTWNRSLKTGVVDHQRLDTDYCMYKGSWDPVGTWGRQGGRVYSTALLAMCLEIYYRYDNVFGT